MKPPLLIFWHLIGTILSVNYCCWRFKLTHCLQSCLLKSDSWISSLPQESRRPCKSLHGWEAALPPLASVLLMSEGGKELGWFGAPGAYFASSAWGPRSLRHFTVLSNMHFRWGESGLWAMFCPLGLVHLLSNCSFSYFTKIWFLLVIELRSSIYTIL